MRGYILLVIILKKRMFPHHIWQVCSALTPVLITAEITNIHLLLKCSNESGFQVLFLFWFVHSSLSLSLFSFYPCLFLPLPLSFYSPGIITWVNPHMKPTLSYFTFSIKHLTIWTCILSRKSSILVWYWCFKKQNRFC